jgi:RHS repeat-associated protein
MIDVNDSNAVYYYHYDALGSVVALSDADGDTVQVYEYSSLPQVAASDPNHTNPFLFTGRRFDNETGLYYYRARYYNPYVGRFLQADPIGYGGGMNGYAYCANGPLNALDPSGCKLKTVGNYSHEFIPMDDDRGTRGLLPLLRHWYDPATGESETDRFEFSSIEHWLRWVDDSLNVAAEISPQWLAQQDAWALAGNICEFWRLQTVAMLGGWETICHIAEVPRQGKSTFDIQITHGPRPEFGGSGNGYKYRNGRFTLYWNPAERSLPSGGDRKWHSLHPLIALGHELGHAHQIARDLSNTEAAAVEFENVIRYKFFTTVPGMGHIYPRPGVHQHTLDWDDKPWALYWDAEDNWENYHNNGMPVTP